MREGGLPCSLRCLRHEPVLTGSGLLAASSSAGVTQAWGRRGCDFRAGHLLGGFRHVRGRFPCE